LLHQPRPFTQVRCDHCGAPMYVPFVPRGIKPIYCRTCLAAMHAREVHPKC
jgi:CxxC-x17-CxxC domain-containing protein